MNNNLMAALSEIQTPAFLYMESFHVTQIKQLLEKINPQSASTRIYYSVKTNDSKYVLEEIAKHVAGLEVISLRELGLAHSISGVRTIIANGPCKSERFLKAALAYGAYIYLDNEDEFQLLETILKQKNHTVNVGLRLMYGNTTNDNKFGTSTNSPFYNKLLKNTQDSLIKITGLHSHISSYEESKDDFYLRISDMKKRVEEFENKGSYINNINIGGGFQPLLRLNSMMEWQSVTDFDEKYSVVQKVFFTDPGGLAGKSLIMEPGRALSEGAIVGVGEVVTIKSVDEKTFVFMDFSTAFAGGSHPAEACISMLVLDPKTGKLYPLKRDNQSKTMLCGPLCSGSDNFGFYSGRTFSIGDRIILLNAGAYSLSFRWHGPEKLPEVSYFNGKLL